MKTCTKCGEAKPLTDYHKAPKGKYGCKSVCKVCCAEIKKAYRLLNREMETLSRLVYNSSSAGRLARERYESSAKGKAVRKEARQRRASTPEGKAANLRKLSKFPERTRTRSMVANALKTDKLTRLPCEVCGNPKSEAHHCDYTKPLDVMWLCRTHHTEWHQHNEVLP